jgi:hypothetical protein
MIAYRAWLVQPHDSNPELLPLFGHRTDDPFEQSTWKTPGIVTARCWDSIKSTWVGDWTSISNSANPVDGACLSPPGPECFCGLWAVGQLDELIRYLPSSGIVTVISVHTHLRLVIGTVRIWGRLIEHEKGLRCQYAQVDSIVRVSLPEFHAEWYFASDQTNHQLAVRYDVPVTRISLTIDQPISRTTWVKWAG